MPSRYTYNVSNYDFESHACSLTFRMKQVTGSCFTQPMRSDFEQIRKVTILTKVVKMVKLETSSFSHGSVSWGKPP